MTKCVLSFVLWLYEELVNVSCLQLSTSASVTSSTVEHANVNGKRLHGPLEASGMFSGVNLFLTEVTPAEAADHARRQTHSPPMQRSTPQSRNAHDKENVQRESANSTLRETARSTL